MARAAAERRAIILAMDANATGGGVPLPVRQVDALSALKWLALGWRDFIRSPLAGLMHGAFVAAAGWVVLAVSLRYGWVAPGAFSGFVIIGPVLVTGLYEISRLQARGERAGVGDAIAAWRRGTRPLVQLGVLLAVLGTLWVGASALLFTLFAPAPLRGPAGIRSLRLRRTRQSAVHAVGDPRRARRGDRLCSHGGVAAVAARPQGGLPPGAADQRTRGRRKPDRDAPLGRS